MSDEIRKVLKKLSEEYQLEPLKIISMLQAEAAKDGDTEMLDVLGEIKWEYIPAKEA